MTTCIRLNRLGKYHSVEIPIEHKLDDEFTKVLNVLAERQEMQESAMKPKVESYKNH